MTTTSYPNPASVFEAIQQRQERLLMEIALARTFVQWRKERDPATRTRLWREMDQAAIELDSMDQ